MKSMPIINKNERKKPGRRERRIYKGYELPYKSMAWRNFSKQYRADNRECALCEEEKDLHVDHIIPTRVGGSMYDIRNMWVLCTSCHSKKTGDEKKEIYVQHKKNLDGELIPQRDPWKARGHPRN